MIVESIGNKMSSFEGLTKWHLQMLVNAIAYSAGVEGQLLLKAFRAMQA